MRAYEDKIYSNTISEIKSAEELTERCFSHQCVIALIETDTFHQESEFSILKEMQIAFSDLPFRYYWIDGICHFEVGKQLKLAPKGAKLIDKSFLFLYNEKTNQYALWKGNKLNKFWVKKDAFRWVKSLRNPANLSRIKFGIDFENRKCERKSAPKKTPEKPQEKPQKETRTTQTKPQQQTKQTRREVRSDEL
jgi:hypothetical protein